jgi:hypothetical protein
MIPAILTTIIILAVVCIALFYTKAKTSNISELALWIQATATVVLVVITGFYAWETRQSRIAQEKGFSQYVEEIQKSRESQEKGFDKYVEELQKSRVAQQENVEKYIAELQEARKQEIKPHIYGLFYYSNNLGKFFLVLKNIGLGPAFEIEASYPAIDHSGKEYKQIYKCPMLAPGKESIDSTPFTIELARKVARPIKIDIIYKNAFGEKFTNSYEDNISTEQPVPTDFAERRRKLESEFHSSDIANWLRIFNESLANIQKELSGIKESIKNKP